MLPLTSKSCSTWYTDDKYKWHMKFTNQDTISEACKCEDKRVPKYGHM